MNFTFPIAFDRPSWVGHLDDDPVDFDDNVADEDRYVLGLVLFENLGECTDVGVREEVEPCSC